MKHGFILSAAVLGLAAAGAPVRAGDIAQITQTGASNVATIEQSAAHGDNRATVLQVEEMGYGWGNHAQLVQYAVGNAVIDVHQRGHGADVFVFQHDGADLHATVTSSAGREGGNRAMIEQSGQGARALVQQYGYEFGSGADIVQDSWGGNLVAEVAQSGDFHQAAIFQSGANLSASVTQSGNSVMLVAGNSATIRQGH